MNERNKEFVAECTKNELFFVYSAIFICATFTKGGFCDIVSANWTTGTVRLQKWME